MASIARELPIAIVGMGCRFPGAAGLEAFWRLLRDGVDAVTEAPPGRRGAETPREPGRPEASAARWGGFLADVDRFDAEFFGLSALEAAAADPQQRLLLEVAWEALEHGCIAPATLAGSRAGVYVGVAYNDYAALAFRNAENFSAYSPSGAELSMTANRLSRHFDLRGPSLAVNTGCSSSLVAVDLACGALRAGECSIALAGGVNLVLAPEGAIALSHAWMLAADGRCKAFDARADGYVRSEGCGLVVLKPLPDALRAGDRVIAVICGSAVNHGGRGRGPTAPDRAAQEAVVREALARAGIAPQRVGFVEAHGVGTPLGDATEFAALLAALGPGRSPDERCAIGAVKTNIGHAEWASGVASLIKAALCLEREAIAPHLHLETLNPDISVAGTPFVVPRALLPWPRGEHPRVAGVNSFGLGGTNAHVVLEEAPPAPRAPATVERPLHLLALSARTGEALDALAGRYLDALNDSAASVADLCHAANAGRLHHRGPRLAAVAASREAMASTLGAFRSGGGAPGLVRGRGEGAPRVAFLFTGQGAQQAGMGRQLYETQPTFRRALDRCAELLDPRLPRPLLSALYPAPGGEAEIHSTALAQPALFALEYALAELWRAWGVTPAAALGHSVGEYVAACIGGAIGLEDALALIADRARLMASLPPAGEMVAVLAPEGRVAEAIAPYRDTVAIAAVNGPRHTVISGERDAVRAVVEALEGDDVATHALKVSHAFHSPLMSPVLDAFERAASLAERRPTQVPIASNLSGELLPVGASFDAAYWRRHLRGAVRFADGVRALERHGCDVFLEIGPGNTLTKLGRRCSSGDALWLSSIGGAGDWPTLLGSVAALYARGAPIDWRAFDRDYPRAWASAPTYPFERRRYWFAPADEVERRGASTRPSDPVMTPGAAQDAGRAAEHDAPLLRTLEAAPPTSRRALLVEHLRATVATLLALTAGALPDPHAGLFALGLHSLGALELHARLQHDLGARFALTPAALFDHPTIDALAGHVAERLWPAPPAAALVAGDLEGARRTSDAPGRRPGDAESIAVVGMACRFPGADGLDAFWRLLIEGGDATTEVPPERFRVDDYYDPDPDHRGTMYTRRGGFLGDVAGFDAAFFGLSPREAAGIDPQQRLFLEIAWEALEHAGATTDDLVGSQTGVFAGIINNDYARLLAQRAPPEAIDASHSLGNLWSATAGRVSHVLGLEGPSMAVDTACSSSLVAVHLACQSLRDGECDRALAGGVNLILSPDGTLSLCRARALAPDGRCKPFDAAADGYARGEGCGVVVLRRLSDALASGDRVLGVIRATAVNHDGRSGGFTVPNGRAQQALLRAAARRAGVSPAEIDYVEAHGTGTPLGDPIEVAALGAVLGAGRPPNRPLALGAVKANIGHLEAAAGVAGLIKALLALEHETIPPQPNFREPNRYLDLEAIPALVPRQPTPWPHGKRTRRAGVSAFGMSGTNAHVIVEEAPRSLVATHRPPDASDPPNEAPSQAPAASPQLLPISARSAPALRALARAYLSLLAGPDDAHPSLADLSHAATLRRSHHEHRLALVAATKSEAMAQLDAFLRNDAISPWLAGRAAPTPPAPDAFGLGAEGPDAPEALARWYVAGGAIGQRLRSVRPRPHVILPSYPWQRRRCWLSILEPPAAYAPGSSVTPRADALPKSDATPAASLSREALRVAAPAVRAKLVEGIVRRRVAEALGVGEHELDADDSLGRFGLDSIVAVDLRRALRDDLGAQPSLELLLREPSVGEIARHALTLLSDRASGPASPRRPAGAPAPCVVPLDERHAAAIRLVCFPHAGAGPQSFRAWSGVLPASVGVLAAHLSGRGARADEPAYADLGAIVSELAPVVERLADRPLAFFGHSMGALVAFELARHLRRHARFGPAHLFVSACPAPDLYDLAGLHALPDAELVAKIEQLGLSPEAGPSSSPEVMRALLPVLRADLGACASYLYRPEAPLAAPITAFVGADDAAVRPAALEGWRRQTSARFELHLCPGGHHYLAHGRRFVTGVVARALLGELPEGARC